MKISCVVLFFGTLAFGQLQDIHFHENSTYFSIQLSNGLKGGQLNCNAEAILEIFRAEPVKGYVKLNNKTLRGWKLNNGETVYEAVQYLVKLGKGGAFALTCLVRPDGALLTSTLLKKDQAILWGHEIWCFIDPETNEPVDEGWQLLKNTRGPGVDEKINIKHPFKGNKEELREFVELMIQLSESDSRVAQTFEIQFGLNYRGSRKKANEFAVKINCYLGTPDGD